MLSASQKKQRLGRITSSVAAAVLDLDPYSSPYDALLRIKGDDNFAGNDATRRGNLMEPACLQFAAEETGLHLKPADFVAYEDWSGDSADALLVDPSGKAQAVVEAKTVSLQAMSDQWGEPGTDDIPEKYLVQCHWHLLHHPTAEVCLVPVVFGGDFVFRLYEVPRDRKFEAHIRSVAKAWHLRHVKGNEPVPIGASHADTQALLKKSPRDWDAMLPCDDRLAELVRQRIDAAKAAQAAQKEVDRLSNLLREAIGTHAGINAVAQGYSVTYRKNTDSARTDWQQVAREMGASEELIYRYTQVVPGARVLRVAKKRQNRAAQNTDKEN